jgi:hypothetical protein
MFNKWDIIYTYHNEPIHLEYLKKSNPNANILLCDLSPYTPFLSVRYCWKNNDMMIRNWIRHNRQKIINPNIALLEWDVLITKELPDIKITGIVGKNIQDSNTDWYWFRESSLLRQYEINKIGITPFAVLFMDQNCIDTWIDHEFDPLYCSDIISELRLPTLLNSKNIKISKISMPNVSATECTYKHIPDFYHPIKEKNLDKRHLTRRY